jgi:hypothetical protein
MGVGLKRKEGFKEWQDIQDQNVDYAEEKG